MKYRMPPGQISIATGCGNTPDEALEGLLPDDAVTVLMNTEICPPTVVYTFWLDYLDD